MRDMHETEGGTGDRAILVSLFAKKDKPDAARDEQSLEELVRLSETAGVEVAGTVVQHREKPDPAWFIGRGKVDEVKGLAAEREANTVIFDQELSGAQVRNLEAALDAKIIDRTQLILDIFAQRARTREGKIQVELAQLSYLLPRLSGHGKNLSRLGGGIGTRGPGETKLETDRRHIRRRIGELKNALHDVVRFRKLYRDRRRKTGVYQVALVGYTNAGKSTLLNRLTGADVLAENKLFATLDPVSRMLRLPGGKEIVLTDTVGFIQNLPHDLVSAFRATLEEVNEADLILHVVDSSSPLRDEQMQVVDRVLEELGAHGKKQLIVYNKIDRCPPEEANLLANGPDRLKISARNDGDLGLLLERIEREATGDSKRYRIPGTRGDLLSLAYRTGDVTEREMDGEDLLLTVRFHAGAENAASRSLSDYELPPG